MTMIITIPQNGESPLTNREVQVLVLLSRGEQHLRIAEELSISVKTVEKHVASARHKLAAPTSAAAVATAIRMQLIHQDNQPDL